MGDFAQLSAGAVFHGRYQVLRRIKSGGMGAVYEVLDEKTDKRRALKIMLPSALEEPDFRARFEREAKITGSIESDHVVHISDAGVDADTGTPFLVMELLRGEELAAVVQRSGALPPPEALTYLSQAALGLDKTHAAGIIHRDLKPENLFLTHADDGSPRVKILDFGIAKVLAPGGDANTTRALGTPKYMAPEQIRGEKTIGPRTDTYALGHIAYTLLTGEQYWEEEREKASESLFLFLEKVIAGPQASAVERAARRRNVTLPPAFDAWFSQATAASPAERFERASAAVAALSDVFDLPRMVNASGSFAAVKRPVEAVTAPVPDATPAQRMELERRAETAVAAEPAATHKGWGTTVAEPFGNPRRRIARFVVGGIGAASLLIAALLVVMRWGSAPPTSSGAAAPPSVAPASSASAAPSPAEAPAASVPAVQPAPTLSASSAEPKASPSARSSFGKAPITSPTASASATSKAMAPGIIDPWAPKPARSAAPTSSAPPTPPAKPGMF